METEAQDMMEPDDARISVAQVAEEVAADLPDYVEVNDGYYEGYRTADAQEMIERAFARLEPKPVSADVEQIAQLAWEAIEHGLTYEGVTVGKTIITKAITAARSPLQAELEQAKAELKAYREGGLTEEILRRNDGYIKVGKGCAITLDQAK